MTGQGSSLNISCLKLKGTRSIIVLENLEKLCFNSSQKSKTLADKSTQLDSPIGSYN